LAVELTVSHRQTLEPLAIVSFTPGFNRVVGFGKNSLTVSTVSAAKKERETVETVLIYLTDLGWRDHLL
jgi:hypothetical protein